MARLQDFPTVAPTSSDKLLVVQSQGQGLVPYGSTIDAKMDKTNPTGTGTFNFNGNEVLSGDLTYNGNVSLSSLLNKYTFNSTSPVVISGLSGYENFIIMGLIAGVGVIDLLVTISSRTLDTPIDLKTGNAWSNSHLTFTYSSTNNTLTISSDSSSNSRITVIRG